MFFCQLAQKVGLAILSGTPPPLRRDTARAVPRASVRSTSDPRLDERDGSSVRAARPFGTARSGPRRGRREGIEICSLKIRECSHLLGGRLLGGRLLRGRDGLRGAHGAGGLGGGDHGGADEGGHGEHFLGRTGRRCVYLNDPRWPIARGSTGLESETGEFRSRVCLRIRALIGREKPSQPTDRAVITVVTGFGPFGFGLFLSKMPR